MNVKIGAALLDDSLRLERLIAAVRLALAIGSLVVVVIDPTQPSKHVGIAYVGFALYLVYSLVVLQLVRSRPRAWLPLATQIVDLLWIPPVLLFTEAGNTPYFPFFVVILLTAGIRWGLWASWAVTIYSVTVYAVLLFIEPPTPLDLNNDLMQLSYFLIVGILGGYLAEYRRKREVELRLLRTTAERIGGQYTASGAMQVVVDTMGAIELADSTVGFILDPIDGQYLVMRAGEKAERLSADAAAPFLSGARQTPRKAAKSLELDDRNSLLMRFADAERGVGYPIRAGDDVVGAIFLFFRSATKRRGTSADFPDLLLSHVIPQLETLFALERAPHARVAEERRRIARDLHDSFIQVLGAFGLRLDVLDAGTVGSPVHQDVVRLRELVGREHKRVRAYVKDMREPSEIGGDLGGLVAQVVEPFEARTDLPVDVSVAADAGELPLHVARELVPMLREALTNVEKHARASRVVLTSRLAAGELTVSISDDGVGFSALQEWSGASGGQGLASMHERAALLGGAVIVQRRPGRGTEVHISIPGVARS